MTPSDFGTIPDIDQDAGERKLDAGSLLEPPWAEEGEGVVEDAEALGIGFAVCAIDVRGVFAALCYRRISDGLPIDDLDLEAPMAAVPVQRGVTRVAPGARIPAPAPIAIRRDKSGTPLEVIAGPMLASARRSVEGQAATGRQARPAYAGDRSAYGSTA